MKRIVLTIALTIGTLIASAMPYSEASQHALFLTDKMAYELNLTSRQYDDVYQINLDYFMAVATPGDIYGPMWQLRNRDLRYVFFDWQYTLYSAADYFFRPLLWHANAWLLPVFNRYDRARFFFPHPRVYVTYHGGGRMDYVGRRPQHWRGGMMGHEPHGGPHPAHHPVPHPAPHMGHPGGHPHHPATGHPGTMPRPDRHPGAAHPGNGAGGPKPGGNHPGNVGGGSKPGAVHPGNVGGGSRPGGNMGGRPTQRPGTPAMGGGRPASSPRPSAAPRVNGSRTGGAVRTARLL